MTNLVVQSINEINGRDFDYPVEVHVEFSLRGEGHGVAYDKLALIGLVSAGLDASPSGRVRLTMRPVEPEARPSPNCGVTEIADGFEADLRVEIMSDDPGKVQRAMQKLGDQILESSVVTEHDVMLTVTHIPVSRR